MSRLVDLIVLLDEAPSTRRELRERCGADETTIRRFMNELLARGLVKPDGWRYQPGKTTNPAVIWRLWK